MTTTGSPPSEELKHLQKLFGEQGIPPQNIVEFLLPHDQVETVQQEIRTQSNGQCYFFTKPLEDRTHVIAFVNIRGIGEVFEKAMVELATKEWQSTISVSSPAEGSVPEQTEF